MVIILALRGNAIKLIDWNARYPMIFGLPAQLSKPAPLARRVDVGACRIGSGPLVLGTCKESDPCGR